MGVEFYDNDPGTITVYMSYNTGVGTVQADDCVTVLAELIGRLPQEYRTPEALRQLASGGGREAAVHLRHIAQSVHREGV